MGSYNRKKIPVGPFRVVYFERELKNPNRFFYELDNGFRQSSELPEALVDWLQKEWEKFTSKQWESDAPGG